MAISGYTSVCLIRGNVWWSLVLVVLLCSNRTADSMTSNLGQRSVKISQSRTGANSEYLSQVQVDGEAANSIDPISDSSQEGATSPVGEGLEDLEEHPAMPEELFRNTPNNQENFGTLVAVTAVRGSIAALPCDIRAPGADDPVLLVLWYKNTSVTPFY
ncbi:unnamed protein product, partial [Meganyctiphanes norvegica]